MKRSTPLKRTGFQSQMPKKSKYGAVRCENENLIELRGRSFPSKLEREVAVMLVIRMRAGEISNLRFQHVLKLTDAEISYNADFTYEEDGRMVVVEAKGLVMERWKIILRLWGIYGRYKLLVYVAGKRGCRLQKTVIPRDME